MSSQEGQHNDSSAGGTCSSEKYLPLAPAPITPVAYVTEAAVTTKGFATDVGPTVLEQNAPALDEVNNKCAQ